MDFIYLAAIDIARRAHNGQLRKYTNEAYITHPFAVAGLVASITTDDDMIVAAILHDVVEDSPIKIETIYGIFNKRIGDMVADLTDVSKKSDGNRTVRKRIDREHTARASKEAKTIKLADLIDNTKTIVPFDPNFAKIYMKEKQLLLEVLQDGDETLFNLANNMIKDYYLQRLETNHGK
jgi:(p)ppGpp synthase/HD superfamily hydrolase